MTKEHISPVLLCGGTGTRLWPLSRDSFPKQFARLMAGKSLLQRTAIRLHDAAFAAPVIVAGDAYRFMVAEQLRECGITPQAILIEPAPRNTAPAVLAAARWMIEDDPIMLVAPTDHLIPSASAFHAAVLAALPDAADGALVTFGIAPDRPETGYGWIEVECPELEDRQVTDVVTFVEKPNAQSAQSMLASGNFFWNSGIFLFRASTILKAFETHSPHLVEPVGTAVDKATRDLDFIRLEPESWRQASTVSIDCAVMEAAQNIKLCKFSSGWSDLGDWNAIWTHSEQDRSGVACAGPAVGINCSGTLLRAEETDQALVGLGLKDIVVVAMADAVLVASRDQVQAVREVVSVLRSRHMYQSDKFLHEHRPWGKFYSLTVGERFHVKQITVNPGGILSLQSHAHRSEHWVVVEGKARVTLEDDVRDLVENESIYIPVGKRHRLENPGTEPLILIEVQTGNYFGEDDIIRYDDRYARGQYKA